MPSTTERPSVAAQWQPVFESYSAPLRKLKYLVRVYDKEGHFDETIPQPLWVVDRIDPSVVAANPEKELLAGYGESRIAAQHMNATSRRSDATRRGVAAVTNCESR